jgi:hypothetical protein
MAVKTLKRKLCFQPGLLHKIGFFSDVAVWRVQRFLYKPLHLLLSLIRKTQS